MKTFQLFNKINITFYHGICREEGTNKLMQLLVNILPCCTFGVEPPHWYLICGWILFSFQIDNLDA